MKGTILVVEDEPDLMLTFRIVLQTAGYVVIKASTGEDALFAIETVVPDAVILDLRLPGIDGWQVLAAIRQVAQGLVSLAVELTNRVRGESVVGRRRPVLTGPTYAAMASCRQT